jgi:RAB6A-GEF complex partner protein 1
LVLHNLEQLDEDNNDAVRLLKAAVNAKDWRLCRELIRFLRSIDETGAVLRIALSQARIVDTGQYPDISINEPSSG